MVTKIRFVGKGIARKQHKYMKDLIGQCASISRWPMGLDPELRDTCSLPKLSVKKTHSCLLYIPWGVIATGIATEVNLASLAPVIPEGKV